MFDSLSEFVSNSVPCFFYTDFKGEHLFCSPLDTLKNHDIEFAFHHPKSPLNNPHKPAYSPISLQNYQKKFDYIQKQIRDGNTYLINLTQPTPIHTPYSLKEIYQHAYAPYKFRVKEEFVCFSPEPFITIEGNTLHTYPMKGTIDATLPNAIETILNDPKEIAEHTMIVDLLRNDLGMVATSIKVKKFRYVTTINAGNKQLHQISSHIRGQLPLDWRDNLGAILKTLLPAGSISGTPKKKTTEILERIEGYERGYFTGVFGYYDGQNLYSAVAIRFIEKRNGQLVYKSGGGITSESVCQKEYEEMLDKIYIP